MNPQVIIAAIPWIRRAWRLAPPQARVPLLLVAAAIGAVAFVQGRRAQLPAHVDGATVDPRSPGGTQALTRGA